MATNSTPVSSESGLSQLVTASPAALPTGTRPEAIAPTTVPMKNGVSSEKTPEEPLGEAPVAELAGELVEREAGAAQDDPERRQAQRDEQGRHDRLEGRPRTPVHSTTRTKISQTWFASQTGPIAQSIRPARARAALAAAGEQRPEPGAEVGAAEDRVERHADPQHARDGVGGAHRAPSGGRRRLGRRHRLAGAVRHLGLARSPRSPAPRHRAQDEHSGDAERRVEQRARPRR